MIGDGYNLFNGISKVVVSVKESEHDKLNRQASYRDLLLLKNKVAYVILDSPLNFELVPVVHEILKSLRLQNYR